MAVIPPKTPTVLKTPHLSPKLAHFKLTIKLLSNKLEELKNKNSDEESSESEGSRDFVRQMQMIEKAIEEQKEKEALTQVKVEQEKQQEEEAKSQKQNEGIEVFEILLREDELKKFRKFCQDNGLEVSGEKHLTQAEEKIVEILHEGRGGLHDHSSERQH
ncbi:MAG: hypothetical protein V4694_04945 [Pseudomonadota bacterium]